MILRDIFKKDNIIAEGGNVSSASPGWQGAPDQEAEEIDLKIHDRDYMVGQLHTLLSAQNQSFKAVYGRYIWDPKILKSGQMFSGSSLQFFDIKSVSTQDFLNKLKKTKVGDIDTQVDQDIGDEITEWLKSIVGKKIGNGTFIGFNSSLSSIWLLDDPQVRIQVDYELGPYQPAQGKEPARPTEWFAYSHSSHYDDMAAGIKGVFHKYINRSLTHVQSSTKYIARVLKKGVKISPEPVTDNDYSFAVSGPSGGGMSMKYKPYIDPTTGQPMEKDGIPVMQQLDPKNRDYIQDLDQQFQINFGRKRGAADKNLQGSFVGTLQLMNKSFTPEQNESVARAFLDILFSPAAQMITKDDPERDRDIKFSAVDAMILGGSGIKPLNLPNAQGLRQEAVKMAMGYADAFRTKKSGKVDTEVAEDAAAEVAAKPNYARQGIKHIYNRLPDGRVSSMEMSNAEFQQVAQEIADNGGTLNDMAVNLKVDGAGIRFGKDSAGRAFMMTSRVTTPLYQDDVGYFTSFGQEKGQGDEQLARTKKYDDALALITGSKFIQTLPSDTIVQAEMMYVPMAEKTDQGLKFVNISYDPKKLGRQMTLVPFMVKQYSTGEELPTADKIIKRLIAASDNNVKIITNRLEQKGINVGKIIQPVLDLDPKSKESRPAFDQAKQELSDAIINSPKLAGKDALGNNMEGVVVNLPSGGLFKVTSSQMKSAMAAKMAPQSFGDTQTRTAVVAIGNFAGHRGHEQLINFAIDKASELGGTPFVFVGHKVGPDDPIDINTKIETLKKLYPNVAVSVVQNQVDAAGGETPGSIFKKIEYELIKKQPFYNNVIVTVGSDQSGLIKTIQQMQGRYSKFPPLAHVKVDLYVTPREGGAGGTGISTTQLRNALKTMPEDQAFNVWSQAYNVEKLGADWIKHLMDVARKNMGIQQKPQPAVQQPAPQPVAERLSTALIRPRTDEVTFKKSPYGRTAASQQRAKELLNPPKPPEPKKDEKDVEEARKKKSRSKNKLSKYFFPGYGYYGYSDSNDSGEGGGESAAEGVDIGQEWMSDTELDQYVPERLQQQWRELLGYDENGNPSALWANLTGGYEPDVNDPQHRRLMVKVANKWFAAKKIPNVKFFDVKDADDELEWLVQIGEQGVAEGEGNFASDTPFNLGGVTVKKLDIGDTVTYLGQRAKIVNMTKDRRLSRITIEKGMGGVTQDVATSDLKRVGGNVAEKMAPKSAFVGADHNKLGSAAHLKGKMKRPAQAGDLVGETQHVPISEDVENIMDALINKIITNEAIQNKRR